MTHIALIVLIMCLNAACVKADKQVTVYVALDRQLAEPLLKQFEADTEIRVRPVYDSESNKTSGLVNRLLAEASRPRADVFWNNETAQMYRLSERGVLVNQRSPAGQDMDSSFDEVSQWSSFAARGRVMVIRPSLIDGDAPASITALVDPRWKGRAAIANPRFGTTGTHFAALLTLWGEATFRQWLREMQANDVAMLPGNAQVKDAVAVGRYAVGFSDTDDVSAALLDGQPVRLIIPDQGEAELGVFIIPNAVALISGAPHAENGRRLVEFLLSPDVERLLAQADGAQIPIRHNVPGPRLLPPLSRLKVMKVDYDEVGRSYERMLEIVDEEWPR